MGKWVKNSYGLNETDLINWRLYSLRNTYESFRKIFSHWLRRLYPAEDTNFDDDPSNEKPRSFECNKRLLATET